MEQGNPHFVGTVVAGEPEFPTWLTAPEPTTQHPVKPPPKHSRDVRELRHLEYDQIFERVIEDIYRGQSLRSLLNDDHRAISYEAFLQWVKRVPARYARFEEAQKMRTEFMAGEILEIADGLDSIDSSSPETVNRDKLRIDARKWLMGSHNKKRYGDVKQVELGGVISVTGALEQAHARLVDAEVIDITPRLEND